jgi:glycosyltransferase involved in cell wall biosynthesis
MNAVSIHVVTYNQAAFLEETLSSAVEQDYDDLEVVVADDGSTDATPAIAKDFEARYPGRVVAITGGPNLGITGNGNRCLRRCRGELVAFLAGDDLFLPGKIRKQVDWFLEDEHRVLSGHDVEHFASRTGETLRPHSAAMPLIEGEGPTTFLERGYPFATSSVMVRASAIPRGGFDERIPVCSDWKFAIDVLCRGGRFGYVPGVFGRYRIHGNNATVVQRPQTWTDTLVGIAIIEAEHPELAGSCRAARAHAYYQRGVAALRDGLVDEARCCFAFSLKTMPEYDVKVPMWLALSHAPAAVRRRIVPPPMQPPEGS